MDQNDAPHDDQSEAGVIRRGSCTCGRIAIEARGAPLFTAVCACRNCRTRTGSAFGVSAYFDEVSVLQTVGAPAVFRGTSRKGRWLDYRFCPDCGTTVWWTAEFRPGAIGVAAGLFADAAFTPTGAYFSEGIPAWVSLGSLPLHPAGSNK